MSYRQRRPSEPAARVVLRLPSRAQMVLGDGQRVSVHPVAHAQVRDGQKQGLLQVRGAALFGVAAPAHQNTISVGDRPCFR